MISELISSELRKESERHFWANELIFNLAVTRQVYMYI